MLAERGPQEWMPRWLGRDNGSLCRRSPFSRPRACAWRCPGDHRHSPDVSLESLHAHSTHGLLAELIATEPNVAPFPALAVPCMRRSRRLPNRYEDCQRRSHCVLLARVTAQGASSSRIVRVVNAAKLTVLDAAWGACERGEGAPPSVPLRNCRGVSASLVLNGLRPASPRGPAHWITIHLGDLIDGAIAALDVGAELDVAVTLGPGCDVDEEHRHGRVSHRRPGQLRRLLRAARLAVTLLVAGDPIDRVEHPFDAYAAGAECARALLDSGFIGVSCM